MKVFGIGLNKTGTSSLGHALRILGYTDHVDGRKDLLEGWANGQIEPILDAAKAFNNFEDWPWPLVYKELHQRFPDAKFILTKRSSADTWFTSLCNHADRTGPTQQRQWVYGHAMPHDHKAEHVAFYTAHNNAVSAYFQAEAPGQLLEVCWEDGNNWDKLCAFLDKPIPSVAFPHFKPLAEQPKQASKQSLSDKIKRFFS